MLFVEWLYHKKRDEKKVIASKTVKRYDKPKTPYERVMESKDVDPSVKRSLKEQFETLNPFQLRKAMEAKMKKIFDYLKQWVIHSITVIHKEKKSPKKRKLLLLRVN